MNNYGKAAAFYIPGVELPPTRQERALRVTPLTIAQLVVKVANRKACAHIDHHVQGEQSMVTGRGVEHLMSTKPKTSNDVTVCDAGARSDAFGMTYSRAYHYMQWIRKCGEFGEPLPHPLFNPGAYKAMMVDKTTNLMRPKAYQHLCPKCGYSECMCTKRVIVGYKPDGDGWMPLYATR